MKPFNPDSEIFHLGFVVGEKRSTPLSPAGSESTASSRTPSGAAPAAADPMQPAADAIEAWHKAQFAKYREEDRLRAEAESISKASTTPKSTGKP